MRAPKTIDIATILKLIYQTQGVEVSRPTIYRWQKKLGFPKSTGMGWPRRWHEDKVKKWLANQSKKQ